MDSWLIISLSLYFSHIYLVSIHLYKLTKCSRWKRENVTVKYKIKKFISAAMLMHDEYVLDC